MRHALGATSLAVLLTMGCGPSAPCAPIGARVVCECSDGTSGTQLCTASGLEACSCAIDGGPRDGGTGVDAGCAIGMTCSGLCVDTDTSALHCGSCDHACGSGEVCIDAECTPPPPRPIAPLTTSLVTSTTPSLRWELPAGAEGAEVDLCRDRACAEVIETLTATGTTVRPTAPLPRGPIFWRLRAVRAGVTDRASSAVWYFRVGTHDAPIDTSWGTVVDGDGDGVPELAAAIGIATAEAAVRVYEGTTDGIGSEPIATLAMPGMPPRTLASAGDVDGDGFGDLLVGAPRGGTGGRVLVFLGSPSGFAPSPATTLQGMDVGGENFGDAVAALGDIDGDGYGDIALGVTGARPPVVLVYRGGPDGLLTEAAAMIYGTSGHRYGGDLAGGDFNGDGYGDLWILDSQANPAHLALYTGGPDGLSDTSVGSVDGSTGAMGFLALDEAGDLDADGVADLVVGATYYTTGSSVVVTSTLAPTTLMPPGTNGDGSQYGHAVAGVGDTDGDGFADMVVGAPCAPRDLGSPFTCGAGQVFWYGGGEFGFDSSGVITGTGIASDPGTWQGFGYAVTGLGDLNGDGFDDAAVSAPTLLLVHVLFGSSSGLSAPTSALTVADAAVLAGS